MGIVSAKPPLPTPRGPVSAALCAALADEPAWIAAPATPDEAWCDDVQLALYLCYELHYRGFRGVSDAWEWDPGLLVHRAALERAFLNRLREDLGPIPAVTTQLDDLLVATDGAGGPAAHLLVDGTREQVREYLVARSLYHLKEADPQTWAIPRVHGGPQAVLVALQYDEYGGGRPERVHARLFADMMAAWGLDAAYGAQLDAAPWEAMALVNLMSLFGLHRAHRGALLGQFARAEITSSPASRRLVTALRRLGADEPGHRFYSEHVEADAVHEQMIRHGVLTALLRDEPGLAGDVAFGLAAAGLVDQKLGDRMVGSWTAGRSALYGPPRSTAVPRGSGSAPTTASGASARTFPSAGPGHPGGVHVRE